MGGSDYEEKKEKVARLLREVAASKPPEADEHYCHHGADPVCNHKAPHICRHPDGSEHLCSCWHRPDGPGRWVYVVGSHNLVVGDRGRVAISVKEAVSSPIKRRSKGSKIAR